ncbi:MAG: serine/threonine protein kinase [Pirellula sp.]|nr:serine/threonine protein kinase [Pirellula sp.]
MTSTIWRSVMDLASDYEVHLRSGLDVTPENFASDHPNIPSEILIPELRRVRDEYLLDHRHPETAQISRYTEFELLRTGGMGEIYRGIDNECQRPVAIKKIRREFQDDYEVRARFHAEAELTASLEHPGIIPIYGQGTDAQGRDFYAMRLIDGDRTGDFTKSIREFHQRSFDDPSSPHRSFDRVTGDLRDLLRRLVDIADTVSYAHSRGVVHRDLKPSNILIGPYGETLIADWGLARRIETSPTESLHQESSSPREPLGAGEIHREITGGITSASVTDGVGTRGFRAPESIHGARSASLRLADVFSLGAILHCIVTNQIPEQQVPEQDARVEPELPKIPGILSLFAVARKAMAVDASDRYASVAAFRDDLLNWIAGEPVSARAETWTERALRWPSRNRTLATGLATAIAITLLGGGVFLWYQAQQKLIVEEQARQLRIALNDSANLLIITQQAKLAAELAEQNAEHRRLEAVENRQVAERRESLAFDGLLKFQDLLVTDQEVFQSPKLATIHSKLTGQSKDIFDKILADLEQTMPPSPNSVDRLSHIVHRLSSMEIRLRKPDQAVLLIDRACQWMQRCLKTTDLLESTAQLLHLRIGELKSLEGNCYVLQGRFQESKGPFEDSIRELEPLIDKTDLSSSDTLMGRLALAKSLSGLSMHEAYHGSLDEAKKLQGLAIERIGSEKPTSYELAMAQAQIHANMSILQERSKEPELALAHLETASVALEDASGMIWSQPAGFSSGNSTVIPTTELLSFRSLFGHERARILIERQRIPSAIELLEVLRRQETESVLQSASNANLLNFYQKTATKLQVLLANDGNNTQASEVSEQWVALAERLLQIETPSEARMLFLISAHHTAGHVHDMHQRSELALESYTKATEACLSAYRSQIRTAPVLYQFFELQMHQLNSKSPSSPLPELLEHSKQATETAEELLRLPVVPTEDLKLASSQFEIGLQSLRNAGYTEAADRWQEELKSKNLLK